VQYLILKEEQLKDLNKILIALSVCGVLFGSYISNYFAKDSDTAWTYYASILIFSFWLLIISLRQELICLIGKTWFRVVLYIIANNFIDRCFGITTWSWNDYLTVTMILIEYLFYKLRNGQNTKYR
jgi:hypothetical protein